MKTARLHFSFYIFIVSIFSIHGSKLQNECKEEPMVAYHVQDHASSWREVKPIPFETLQFKNKICTAVPFKDEQCDEEKILTGKDRREKIHKMELIVDFEKKALDVTELIVQLYMNFGGKAYVGSGTIIDRKGALVYILTCAHNIITYHSVKKKDIKVDQVYFTLKGKPTKKYACKGWFAHPSYKKREGKDIALLYSYEGDDTFPSTFADRAAMKSKKCLGYVLGYPGEKERGVIYGMKGLLEPSPNYNKGVIAYKNIDTTGGQSGSPIFSSIGGGYVIIGVHTTGSSGENYGTCLSSEILAWEKGCCATLAFSYDTQFEKNLKKRGIDYDAICYESFFLPLRTNKWYIDYIRKQLTALKRTLLQMKKKEHIQEAKSIAQALSELPQIRDPTLHGRYESCQFYLSALGKKAGVDYENVIDCRGRFRFVYPMGWVIKTGK